MTVRPVAPQIELRRMSLSRDMQDFTAARLQLVKKKGHIAFASRKTHLPRILSISSHFLTSFTYFRWNVLTVGLSWGGEREEF